MKRVWFAGGIFTTLVGMGFVMPAIALLRDKGELPAFEVGFLLLGLAIAIGGLAACARGVARRQA